MRILFANTSDRMVGGAEDYISRVAESLSVRGYDVALAFESSNAQQEPLRLPVDARVIGPCSLLNDFSKSNLQNWKPDIVYVHGELSLAFEETLRSLAPSIYFAHNYYGTCISGLKVHRFPVIQPCSKRFGASCLAYYLPRGCGGANPITMLERYSRERVRLESIRSYDAIVTHSRHMTREYERNGVERRRLFNFVNDYSHGRVDSRRSIAWPEEKAFRVLFVGRMEDTKGGALLLESLPMAQAELKKPVRLTMAGDGRERASWQALAARIETQYAHIQIDFTGWLDAERLSDCYASADLLAVPSIWPEPFGRVGLDAGKHGVPSVAFDVGGISDWLRHDVNGYLAPGTRPAAEGLARAIVAALKDQGIHRSLQDGARRMAAKFSMSEHIASLEHAFHTVLEEKGCVASEPSLC